MVKTTELNLTCPDLKTQQDEMIIHEAMMSAPGIGLVETDYRTGQVHIVTANQDGGIDVLDRLDHAGYPVAATSA